MMKYSTGWYNDNGTVKLHDSHDEYQNASEAAEREAYFSGPNTTVFIFEVENDKDPVPIESITMTFVEKDLTVKTCELKEIDEISYIKDLEIEKLD